MMNRRDVLTGVIGVTGAAIVGLPVLAAAPVPLAHNDAITRAALKEAAEQAMSKTDAHEFCVICDDTNNHVIRIEEGFVYVDTMYKRRNDAASFYAPFKVNAKLPLSEAKTKLADMVQRAYADPSLFPRVPVKYSVEVNTVY